MRVFAWAAEEQAPRQREQAAAKLCRPLEREGARLRFCDAALTPLLPDRRL